MEKHHINSIFRSPLRRGLALLLGAALLPAALGGGVYFVMYRLRRDPVTPRVETIALTDLAKDGDRVTLIADGGLAAVAPKNTAAALVSAQKAGFGQVLLFVRQTADGVWVVTENSGADEIRHLTVQALRRRPVRQGANADSFSRLQHLTLEEALRLCAQNALAPVIECETMTDGQLDALIALLERDALLEAAVVASYDGALLKRAVGRYPAVRFCYSVTALSIDFAYYLENAGVQTVMFSYAGDETAELAKSYLADGFTLVCRGTNSIPVFEAMYACGVRRFVTERILYAT